MERLRRPDTNYDEQTIQYTYDALSRLIEADYDSGATVYTYGYDLAGNLVDMDGAARTYNAANQMTHDGTNSLTYDDNGNLTSDGVNDYVWDRANRLLEVDTGTPAELTAYAYDGVGNRFFQAIGTSSPVVTQYLLDTQPGLTQVLAQTAGAVTDRFIHSPRGIHAHQDDNGDWFFPAQDGLGSVRGVADDVSAVQGMQHYAPYGTPFGAQGSLGMPFGFTGEQTDANDLVYLRARYLSPGFGTFLSLDPFEGMADRPMSLNGYTWVEGNASNNTDPSGLLFWSFPSAALKTEIANPNRYLDPNGQFRAEYAHAWIEFWLEKQNGFWETQLEYPGFLTSRIDAIVFDTPIAGLGYPGQTIGHVFEIEPVNPTIKIAQGYFEAEGHLKAVRQRTPPFLLKGQYPQFDLWYTPRPAGGNFDWTTYVTTWQLGSRLSPSIEYGPVRIDPNQLGASGIPGAWWIMLPVDGLILYVSEDELRRKGLALTAAAVEAYILNQYLKAKGRSEQGRKGYTGPEGERLPDLRPGYAGISLEVPVTPEAVFLTGALICTIAAPEIAIPLGYIFGEAVLQGAY